jgi:3-hydroxybutyryl-CoA dehydrogenase
MTDLPERLGIVGAGTMGAGIAQLGCLAGIQTLLYDLDRAALDRAEESISRNLDKGAERGRWSAADAEAARGRLSAAESLDALGTCELVIEAAPEKFEIKRDLFRQLGESGAILATNTSSIPVMKLAVATTRPQNVVGIHFFNPVPVLQLVELVPSLLTAPETTARARSFVEGPLGKTAIDCQDRAGFVVNALLIPFVLSAIRMLESGFATAEDIDNGLVLGAAHPQGPLALADLIGLDTTKAVAESLYEEFKEPLYAAPPLLNRMVDAGLLGRKTGRGFYTY